MRNSAIALVALLSFKLTYSEIGPQMKDFLCGCDYCETVDTGFPLDISSHMARCHRWRKGMKKTMELMRQAGQSKVKIKIYTEEPMEIEENLVEEIDLYKDYAWEETQLHGWAYTPTNPPNPNTGQWIHLKDLGWVWSIANATNLIYSYDHGWLYAILHQNSRVLYWYNRGRWILPTDFTLQK